MSGESKNITFTENGAVSHADTGDARLNYFSKVLRDSKTDYVTTCLNQSWSLSPLDTMRLVAQKRDCRGGSGEKKVFYESVRHLITTQPKAVEKFLPLVPYYGTWKDGFKCFGQTDLEPQWLTFVANQLKTDLADLKSEHATDETTEVKKISISLCAKWVPSEGSSLDRQFKGIYSRLTTTMGLNKNKDGLKQLRVTYLTPLREYLNIVETLMCKGQWIDIKYEHVPSVAMNRLRKAFMKKDKERFSEFLQAVTKGEKKIKSGQLFPHQMVKPYLHNSQLDLVLEEQWKAYVKQVANLGQLDQAIVVSDVSGSMTSGGPSNDRDLPLQVSIALGLMIATLSKGDFKGSIITFHEKPSFHHIDTNDSLFNQVESLKNAHWGGSTNLQAVFELILEKAVPNHIKQVDMPKTLIIVSDMQFDRADRNYFTNHEVIKAKYRFNGYEMPQIIYWNVAGRTEDSPVTKNEIGAAMVAGFSPAIMKYITSGVISTPYELMRDVIDSERYACIKLPETSTT